MLEGLLVDLVPYGSAYRDLEHTWRNHEASYWASGGDRPIVTRAQIKAHFENWAERHERPDAGVTFGVQTKDGTPIGFFTINWLVPHHRLAMLGARIGDPAYWGGGYGTDALALLVDYAFDWLDIHKVWLSTTSGNARVQRQMEKVGFALEARNRDESLMDGVWTDGLVYGLLREQWPGRAAVIERIGLKARDRRTVTGEE